jgi:hypothetical protein
MTALEAFFEQVIRRDLTRHSTIRLSVVAVVAAAFVNNNNLRGL